MDAAATSDRIELALARIGAAAERIEIASQRRSVASGGGDPELQTKYDALRREAGEALEQLDALLGAMER